MGNSSESTALGASKIIVVPTEDGDVIVRRLALGEYAGLLRAFKKLPGELGQFIDGSGESDFKNSSTAEMIQRLLPVLEGSWLDLVGILALPTDKDEAFIAELDAGDAMEVLAAMLELNNYRKVLSAIKKLRALGQTEKPAEPVAPAPAEA